MIIKYDYKLHDHNSAETQRYTLAHLNLKHV